MEIIIIIIIFATTPIAIASNYIGQRGGRHTPITGKLIQLISRQPLEHIANGSIVIVVPSQT